MFVVYRPPNSDYMPLLLECLATYKLTKVRVNIIVGDLNCPDIDWDNFSSRRNDEQNELLKHVINEGYCQLVCKPTRHDNVLDVVLTDEPLVVSNVQVGAPFSSSDHSQVSFSILVEGKHQHHVNELRCWKRADYQAMSQYFLDVDWLRLTCMSENLTPDTLWSAFCEVLNNAIEQFVPIQHVRNTHCSVIKNIIPITSNRP